MERMDLPMCKMLLIQLSSNGLELSLTIRERDGKRDAGRFLKIRGSVYV